MTVRLGALLLLLLPALGCPRSDPPPAAAATPDPAAACCAECATAAAHDPAGTDLSLLPCAEYAREPGALSAGCAAWFAEHPRMVQDCR